MSHQTYLDYISSYFKSNEDFAAFQEALKKPLSKTITLVQSRSKTEDTLRQLNEEGFQTIVSDYNANNFKVARLLSSEVTKSLSSEVTKLEHSNLVTSAPSNLVTSAPSNLSQPSNISQPIGKTIGHLLGNFYIQETAASLPAIYVDIPMEGHILDMCAAPGGKTMQLGDRCKIIGSKAIVRANEPDSKRLQVLESNIARCGMDNVVITQHGGEQFGNLVPEMFDVILLDAPCSGEGTGFKSDFGTKFWDIHKIKQIAHLQYQLLESALKACKVGGQIMYSTCTINSVENEENVIKLMESYPGILEIEEIENKDTRSLSHYDTKPLGHYVAKPLSNGITKPEPSNLVTSQPSNLDPSNINPSDFKRLRPHIQHTGGFFMCKIRKTGSLRKEQPIKSGHKIKAAKYALCNQIAIRNWLKNEFGISISDELTFIQSKNQIYLSHTSIIPYLQLLHIYCPGLAVIKGEKEQDWRPLHDAGLVFDFHSDYQLPLDKEQLLKHINQEDFELNTNQRQDSKQGFVQLLYDNNKVGIGKIVGITIKNKFQGIL